MSTDEYTARANPSLMRSLFGLRGWAKSFGRIKYKVGIVGAFKLNVLQQRIRDAVEWCLEHDQPIRLVVLKPRQKGCSTISMALLYWMMCRAVVEAVVIGGQSSQANNLWQIFKRFAMMDAFDWGFERPVGALQAEFLNGSRLQKETAGDKDAGRSGTFQAVVGTEVARWAEQGVKNATDVMTGLMACVPYEPGTLVLLESTARGPSGLFYELWRDGVTLQQLLASGVSALDDGQFITIFAGCHEFEDSKDKFRDPRERDEFERSLNPEEKALMAQYGQIDPEFLKWRRRTIRNECKKDIRIFRREYPMTPDEAFSASAPSVFDSTGLAILNSRVGLRRPDYGIIEDPTGRQQYVWRTVSPEASQPDFIVWEHPIPGRRYLISVDVMSGEANDDRGDDRDHHVCCVLRQGYVDADGQWVRPCLAARTTWPCQWPIVPAVGGVYSRTMLEMTWRLHRYYGGALLIPETNNDRGLTPLLVEKGAHVYQRERGDTDPSVKDQHAKMGRYGVFLTSGRSANAKAHLIENLAAMVRADPFTGEFDPMGGLDIWDERTLHEMSVFVTHKNGRMAALETEHDDSIMALAIGCGFLGAATPYQVPRWDTGMIQDPMMRPGFDDDPIQSRQRGRPGFGV